MVGFSRFRILFEEKNIYVYIAVLFFWMVWVQDEGFFPLLGYKIKQQWFFFENFFNLVLGV